MSEKNPYRCAVIALIFPITDLAQAVAYYRDQLLFSVGFEWADEPDEPMRYAILQNGDVEIHLTHSETASPTNAYVFVDDVSALYEAISARGPTITEPLTDHPWDMREFEVSDPDGNRLVFGEHLSRINETAPTA